jgi:hypothetical protein
MQVSRKPGKPSVKRRATARPMAPSPAIAIRVSDMDETLCETHIGGNVH